MTIDRIATLCIIAAGLFFLLFIIPRETETVAYGWIAPRTAPTLALAVILAAAVVQLFRDTGDGMDRINRADETPRRRPTMLLRVAAIFVMVASAVLAMPRLGFVVVAPTLALAIMLTVGERRWYWLLFTAGALPAAIWFAVVELLGRRLP